MRDPERIPRILDQLQELWERVPDQRFGQFLINHGIVTDDVHVWYREDDQLEKALKNKVASPTSGFDVRP